MGVYFYGCITLDGYLADSNHSLEWLHETGGSKETGYDSFYKNMDIVIMGRKTFDEIAHMEGVESFYKTTKNYVFTHRKNISVKGFEGVSGDIVEFVRRFPQKNIWIVGGNTLIAPLLNHNMIDEIIIQIAPVLLGRGISLFTQEKNLRRYFLKKVNKYGQFAELVYKKL